MEEQGGGEVDINDCSRCVTAQTSTINSQLRLWRGQTTAILAAGLRNGFDRQTAPGRQYRLLSRQLSTAAQRTVY